LIPPTTIKVVTIIGIGGHDAGLPGHDANRWSRSTGIPKLAGKTNGGVDAFIIGR